MQTRQMYSIYDKVADDFGPVFEAVNDAVAMRQYNIVCQKVDYPNDYELVHIGSFNGTEIKQDIYPVIDKVLEVVK